jgi:hypothetical protein
MGCQHVCSAKCSMIGKLGLSAMNDENVKLANKIRRMAAGAPEPNAEQDLFWAISGGTNRTPTGRAVQLENETHVSGKADGNGPFGPR